MSKMFVHYSGTVEAFKAAKKDDGKSFEEFYSNHIVFIKGGKSGTGAAVYTHGEYFGDLAELQAKVNGLKYFSKISDGNTIAEVASASGTITIQGEDPAVTTKIDPTGIKIGLSDEFKTAVNTTLPGAISGVDAKLGAKDAAAATGADATAFGRIKNLEEVVAGLTGTGEGDEIQSVGAQITNAINALDVDATAGDYVASISQADGKIVPVMGTFNFEEAGAAAAVQGNLDTEVLRAKAAEEANANAIAAEKARMDAFMLDADVQGQAVDTLKEIQAYITSDGAAAQEMLAAIEAAQGAADAAQGEVDALEGVVAGVKATADAAATQVALQAEIDRADAAEKANAAAIKAISDDYLKASDKTELQGNIDAKVAQSAYDTKVAELAGFWEWEEI